jgi:hypothetical protein
MVVNTQCTRHEVIGLCIGATNVRRHFSRGTGWVELHLDHLEIQCRLPPDFWLDTPEIRDRRLCEWLNFKICHESWNRRPTKMEMEQTGTNCFTIHSRAFQGFRQSDATVDSVPQFESIYARGMVVVPEVEHRTAALIAS